MNSGLYSELIAQTLLIPHAQISKDDEKIIIQPDKIPFILYPYEWSFLQLKDAALLTLSSLCTG